MIFGDVTRALERFVQRVRRRDSFWLPADLVRCGRCKSQMRYVEGNFPGHPLHEAKLVVCDTCERYTVAPKEYEQIIADMIGEFDRRN